MKTQRYSVGITTSGKEVPIQPEELKIILNNIHILGDKYVTVEYEYPHKECFNCGNPCYNNHPFASKVNPSHQIYFCDGCFKDLKNRGMF